MKKASFRGAGQKFTDTAIIGYKEKNCKHCGGESGSKIKIFCLLAADRIKRQKYI